MVWAAFPVTVLAALAVELAALLAGAGLPADVELLAAGLLAAAEALRLGAGLALAEGTGVASADVVCDLNDSRKTSADAVLTIARMTRRMGAGCLS
jgi:hypothetical protein